MPPHARPLSETFLLVVADLMTGTGGAVEAFMNLVDSFGRWMVAQETNDADDCTEGLLAALGWGIREYGLNVFQGYAFFRGLALLNNALCSR